MNGINSPFSLDHNSSGGGIMFFVREGMPICVPKVPFRCFDKLKYEIRNKVLILVSILKLRQKTSK